MATLTRNGVLCAPVAPPHTDAIDDEFFTLDDFEVELRRLNEVNQQLLDELNPSDNTLDEATPEALRVTEEADELAQLREENRLLKSQLEAFSAAQDEEPWLERQREYEMMLEEKSEVIRGLHQKMNEMQESVSFAPEVPAAPSASSIRLGQAEEILRLKREMDEQRRQLEQDEQDMMAQMRQMEITMARERAEMARHRQEIVRLQKELARETENANRDPGLREKLHSLRRTQESKIAPPAAAEPVVQKDQESGGFFRRMFG